MFIASAVIEARLSSTHAKQVRSDECQLGWLRCGSPSSGRAEIQGGIHDISKLHLAIQRLYDLTWERVWTITFFSHFLLLSDVVISCMYNLVDAKHPDARHGFVTPRDLHPACQRM